MDCIHHSFPKLYRKVVKMLAEGIDDQEIYSEVTTKIYRWLRMGGGIHGLHEVAVEVGACDGSAASREKLLGSLQANQVRCEGSLQSQILTRAALSLCGQGNAEVSGERLAYEYLRKSIEHGVADRPGFITGLGVGLDSGRATKARFMDLMDNGLRKLAAQLDRNPQAKGIRKPPKPRSETKASTGQMLDWGV